MDNLEEVQMNSKKGGDVISIFSHPEFVTSVLRRRQYQLPIITESTLAMYPALVLFVGECIG